jgi:hypothetical protein
MKLGSSAGGVGFTGAAGAAGRGACTLVDVVVESGVAASVVASAAWAWMATGASMEVARKRESATRKRGSRERVDSFVCIFTDIVKPR